MSALDQALVALRDERDQLTGRLRLVERALDVLKDLGERDAKPPKASSPRPRAPAAASQSGWTCKACGQQGHTARSKTCPKRVGAQTSASPSAEKAFGRKVEAVEAELAGPVDRLQKIKARAGVMHG